MLNKKQTLRLAPFFNRKSARQRIILYLLATGYRVPDLVNMSEDALDVVILPDELEHCRDEMHDNALDERYFVYPMSKEMQEGPRKDIVNHLLATGYQIDELRSTPMAELSRFKVAEEMVHYRTQLAETAAKEQVFVYPCGRPLVHTDYYRLIRNTTEKILGKKLSQDKFYRYIKTGKL